MIRHPNAHEVFSRYRCSTRTSSGIPRVRVGLDLAGFGGRSAGRPDAKAAIRALRQGRRLARYTFHARDGMARWVGLGVIAKTSPLRSVVGRARPSAPSWPALTGLAAMRRP